MLKRALILLVVLLVLAPSACASEWLYTGTVLPTSAGWAIYGSNSLENGAGITSVADGGVWKLSDSSTAYRCLLRNLALGDVSFDTGVTCVARIKCESASANCSYVLGISNGTVGGMFIKLTTTQLYLTDLSGRYRGICSLDATAYHSYHITAANALPGDNSTAVWRVYVDGVEAITWTGAGEHAGYDGIMAGHGGLSGTGAWYFDAIAATNDGAFAPDQWNPIPGDPPARPSVVVPVSGAVVGMADPLVCWTAEKHDQYEVHINTTNSPADTDGWDSSEVISSENACTGGELSEGTYYVFVRVHGFGGWSQWSEGVSFRVSADLPRPQAPNIIIPGPEGVTCDTTPTLQWTGETRDAYQIRLTTSGSADQDIAWDSRLVVARGDSADAGPLPTGEYYAFVRVHGPGGWSPWNEEGRRFRVDPSAPKVLQGWVLLRDEPIDYYEELLSHAPEYHVNTVHISHEIMMYIWEPLNDPARRLKINQIISSAHVNGVDEVVAWIHEIQDNSHWRVPAQYKTADGRIDLDQEAFWDWLADGYARFFDACPDLDGVVLTLTENFVYGGADVYDRTATKHTGKTPEDSCLKLIQTIWSVCQQRSKSLYVRNWTLYGGADRWIRNAVMRTNEPDIWLMSKATGAGDWDVIQEPYDIIGTCTGHPEMLEFDVTGEYWGYTWTPWSGVDYIRHLWTEFAYPRGAGGMVARIDREDHSQAPGMHPRAIEGPNRINLYALDVLANYPMVTGDAIYDYFCSHWFGHAASERAESALKRSFAISNACYNLPKPSTTPDYSFSDSVARSYCLASLFDIDCANAELRASSGFQPASGLTDYEVLRGPFERAAAKLGQPIPRTLFGDFLCTPHAGGGAACSVRLVDAAYGFAPATLTVRYSSDAGATWSTYPNPSVVSSGSAMDPFTVTMTSVPFASASAARNRVRFEVAYPGGARDTRDFTVKSADWAWANLGNTISGDGILHPQPQNGDGDTVAATAGGRPCRRAATSEDTSFYFHVDDGFCFDGSPQTLYLQVDYYGSGGSITPVYDSRERTDETLTPVYLSGLSAWRTATWRLGDVNFGNRLASGADLRLYVGAGANVYIGSVRLYENPPQGTLGQTRNLTARAVSPTQVALSWGAVPGAARYQVCRGATCAGWATGETFTDSQLTPNTQYGYTVTAYDDSGFTSPASDPRVVTTLANQPAVACGTSPGEWSTDPRLVLSLPDGFGWGSVGYFRYAFDDQPMYQWTGDEPTWPAGIDPPQGCSVWRPSILPTEPGSGWLLYDGSTTQRCMSEELVTEAEGTAWRLVDQGRVVNTKAKLACWPTLPVDRGQGVTVTVRMKAADSPLGWADSGPNFGLNLPDCAEVGVSVRPDYLRLSTQDGDVWTSAVGNGFSYHTYTLTLRNRSYVLYRDGQQMLARDCHSTPESMWSGPFFGHSTSNAVGAWSFQWIAWRNGFYPPSSWNSSLTLTAPGAGGGYYAHLLSHNADGTPSGSVDLGPFNFWDGSTPVAPKVTDDGDYTTAGAIHAAYTVAAPSVSRYEYAIGSLPGAQDIVPYTSNGQMLDLARADLSLEEGRTYFVSVRGVGAVTGPEGVSDGIEVAPKCEHISDAKAQADGSPVALYGMTVSAVFGDCVYVRESAMSAVRVVTKAPVEVGDVIDLAGVMRGSGAERYIAADSLVIRQSAE